MRFYKSILFILGLNLLLVLPAGLFLGLRYLIPALVLVFILDMFLLFFSGAYTNKKFTFSAFSPDDPYGLGLIIENLKKRYNQDQVQLLKVQGLDYSFFYFRKGPGLNVILSENLAELFSREDLECLLSYPFRMNQSGDLLFLTVLSNFLFLVEKTSNFFGRQIFGKKRENREGLLLVCALKLLSLMARGVFGKADAGCFSQKRDKERQALFLWRLDSLMKVKTPPVFAFLSPLFLMNPLTNSVWESYISFQPLIKDRVQLLTGVYPP